MYVGIFQTSLLSEPYNSMVFICEFLIVVVVDLVYGFSIVFCLVLVMWITVERENG